MKIRSVRIVENKKILTCLCIIVALFIVLLTGYIVLRLPGQGMVLPFKEVDVFSRNEIIENYLLGHSAWQSCLLEEQWMPPIKMYVNGGGPSIEDMFMGQTIMSIGEGYYEINKDILFKYDTRGNVIKQISISEFGLNPEEYYFNEILALSNEKIWLAVYYLKNGEWKDAKLYIIEWPLDLPAKDSIIAKMGDLHAPSYYVAIDENADLAYVFCGLVWDKKPLDGVYDFSRQEFIHNFPPIKNEFSQIDYKNGGILLSTGYWEKDYIITYIDPNTGLSSQVAKGAQAFWGPQGEIYFIRGTGQLWRCNQDGSEQEPVFLATKFPINVRHVPQLWLSNDRTFIVFVYSVPIMTGGRRYGILFIDLEKKEYLNRPHGSMLPIWKLSYLTK